LLPQVSTSQWQLPLVCILRPLQVTCDHNTYAQAYACLRHIVQEHIISGNALLLSESPKPISKYKSVEMQGRALLNLVQKNAEFVQMQDSQDHL
jgi:hypothetical protein